MATLSAARIRHAVQTIVASARSPPITGPRSVNAHATARSTLFEEPRPSKSVERRLAADLVPVLPGKCAMEPVSITYILL